MRTIFVLISIVFIASCKTLKKGTDSTILVIDTVSDYSFRKVMRDKEIFDLTTEVVPLDTVYLSKDTLHLLTKRIIGCDEEDFKLLWNGMIAKSFPPQTTVKLFQRLDPACNERHYFHLTYNLKSLQLKNDSVVANENVSNSKATIIKIGGWKNSLKYEF